MAPAVLCVELVEKARVQLFNIGFDPLSLSEATARLLEWARADEYPCRIVVTPNVDHVVLVADRPELLPLYETADLVLADGQPVIWASRLLGARLPERVAGSDLFPNLLAAAVSGPPVSVFLLGGGEGVAERAAAVVRERYPWIRIAGTHCPPLGFENRELDNERAVAAVSDAAPDIVMIGLGAPKQERWVHRERARLRCKVALCIGATVDFIAGVKPRAPRWMRRTGTEWIHRLASEPKRLTRRYAHDAWVFPKLVAQEALRRAAGA